jgi:hypothetical protein
MLKPVILFLYQFRINPWVYPSDLSRAGRVGTVGLLFKSASNLSVSVLVLLLLAACAPASLPLEPVQRLYVTQDNLIALNSKLLLRAYPTILITSWAQRDYATDVTFESPLLLDTLHSHFHFQLVGSGWQRSRLTESKSQIQARYQRGTERLEFRLRVSGNEFRLQTW